MTNGDAVGNVVTHADASAPPHDEAGHRSSRSRVKSLFLPFLAVFFLAVASLLVFAVTLTVSLDRQAIGTSERIFASALENKSRALAKIALEYGYWDAAVENLVDRLDQTWIASNLETYIYEELDVDGLHVLDATDGTTFSLIKGKPAQVEARELYGADLTPLVAQAKAGPPDQAPIVQTAVMGDLSRLFLVSAVRLTTYTDERNIGSEHVLVLSQELTGAKLIALSAEYELPGLLVTADPPGLLQASYEIRNAEGDKIGAFVWSSPLPGLELFPIIALAIILIFAGMFFAANTFLKRTALVVADLETAQDQVHTANAALSLQLLTDPLTGLGNRRALDQKLSDFEARVDGAQAIALLYVDLDNFKAVNDTHGHEAGDAVLQYTAETLQRVAPNAAIYRLGGDEFVMIFEAGSEEAVMDVASRIVDEFRTPLAFRDATCTVGASIGIAFQTEPHNLLRDADNALYAAKRNGKGRYIVHRVRLGAQSS